MVIRQSNQRTSYRYIYAGILKPIFLLKRNDDQQQGVVQQYKLFDCRRGNITKRGQTLEGDMNSDHRTDWFIPRVILENAGIRWLNPLDRVVEYLDDGLQPLNPNRVWQTESTTSIDVKLFETWVILHTLRVDPNLPGSG